LTATELITQEYATKGLMFTALKLTTAAEIRALMNTAMLNRPEKTDAYSPPTPAQMILVLTVPAKTGLKFVTQP
jgi:hypothetical protein